MPHTPGPWEVDDCGNIEANGAVVAAVHRAEDFPCLPEEDFDEVNIECAANARLIAAAPDLLAVCEAVMEFLSNGTPVHPGALVQAELFNAIAKAEGRRVMLPTPGPWHSKNWTIFSGEGATLSVVGYTANNQRSRTPRAAANARLMAASPDLLAACEEALDLLNDLGYHDATTGDTLRAAIAKAKGGE